MKKKSQVCQVIEDESNQHGTEQESLLEQERLEQIEITFTLRKNGGYIHSRLGSRLFPVVRLSVLADKKSHLKILKL